MNRMSNHYNPGLAPAPQGLLAIAAVAAMTLVGAFAGSTTFAQEGALFVVEGKVGIGTESPLASLEIRGETGATTLLVDENSPSHEIRSMFTIENNGPVRMVFKDTHISKSWRLGSYFGNTFRLDTPSGPGIELELDQDGNMTLKGSLNQSSSRALKENFTSLDPQSVLERVAGMPITQWNYTHDSTGAQHIGPMAEDFRASFNLGKDEKHLAPSDTAGVALVAIKGLHEVVQSDREGLTELRQENVQLKTKIDALEELQEQLLRRLEALESR